MSTSNNDSTTAPTGDAAAESGIVRWGSGHAKWRLPATDILQAQTEEAVSGIVYWETGGVDRPKWPLPATDILQAQSGEAASGIVYWESGGFGHYKWPLTGTDILKDQAEGEASGDSAAPK